MAEQVLTLAIQILFPLALLKFTLWSMVLRPLLAWIRRPATAPPPHRRRRRAGRRQPPPPDPLEVSYVTGGPYVDTVLSDELYQAVAVLLVLYGSLGIDARDLATAIHTVDLNQHVRAVTRIKATAERLAEAGIDDNLAATGYMLELADRLRGLNRMQALS